MNIRTKPHHKSALYMGDNRISYTHMEIQNVMFNADKLSERSSNSTYIQNHAASSDIFYRIARAILLHWSRPAIQYLIGSASELAKMHWAIHCQPNQTIEVDYFTQRLQVTTVEKQHDYNSYDSLIHWLDGASMAILADNPQAKAQLNAVPAHEISRKTDLTDFRPIEQDFFHLFKAFLFGEQNKEQQAALLQAVVPYLTSELIAEAEKGEPYWMNYYEFLIFPLYSLIAISWGFEATPLDQAVEASIEANYQWYAYFAEQNGGKTGEESLHLNDRSCLFHNILTAFLKVHYQQTGETPSFDSLYAPMWLIKGEGLSFEALKANPPEFTVESVLAE
ncbi:immunity 49 family protein [Vibrio vulnificus]|uniref:immunity 49 family protein n=2 Tax=Vibrionaceae TaxID=641 RepID=UPI00058A3AAA|nr:MULTISPECIES: immunity 49 family protein [Vibrio]EHU5195810.1 immunity 49 family protein [Vibrio vulnificus]EIX4876836.1 immunity 49 family protein [Vibrio vulnificus]EJR3609297.1 immunity 49 family protein [Vibrio vulnificus]EJV9307814.1 immunity 49 family protein [Vibrio vulnificus]ELA3112041.1 immunity 49 family protein [Vibrio vulnificus]